MSGRAETLARALDPVSLDDLTAETALLTRIDTKYVVTVSTFAALLERLADRARVLDIDGRRLFTYDTVYFDSPQLTVYRSHLQGRRRRFKCRSRRYVETGRHVFEVKLKGPRGQTIKRQLSADPLMHTTMTAGARAFLDEVVAGTYGRAPAEPLRPTLSMTYSRMTLVPRVGGERVTCDFAVTFLVDGRPRAMLRPDRVILETKSARGRGVADKALLGLGARPVECSKYCAGVALTVPSARSDNCRRRLLGEFEPVWFADA